MFQFPSFGKLGKQTMVMNAQGQQIPVMPNMPQQNNEGFKVTGLLGAIAAGISPNAYAAGQNLRQQQILKGIQDPEQQMNRAIQMGAWDWVNNANNAQLSNIKVQDYRNNTNFSKALSGLRNARPVSQPVQQPMGATPMQPMAQAPIDQTYQPAPNGENVVVTGQRQIPANERVPVDPYERYNFLLSAADLASKNGLPEAYKYYEEAQKEKTAIDAQKQQYLSAIIAPAYQVQDDPTTPQNEHQNEMLNAWDRLAALGFKPDVHTRAALEREDTQGKTLMRQITNMGDMKEAAQAEIKRQNPNYQTDNLGDRFGVFNPTTGQYVGYKKVGLNPTQVRGQNMQAAIAAANRDLQKYAIDIRAKIAKGQLSVAQGNLAIRQRQLELGLPVDSEVNNLNEINWDN